MRGLRVVVVKKYRQTISNRGVERNGCFEQLFLDVARQIRPQPQGGLTEQSFEFDGGFSHSSSCMPALAPSLACI